MDHDAQIRAVDAVGVVDAVDSLATRAYDMLRDAILSNRLEPGTRLSVSDLARRMRISRTPVREAVQRLIHDGLAMYVPHRGAEVMRVGADDLRQLFQVREVLDGLAARLASGHMGAAERSELELLLDDHQRLLSEGAGSKVHVELDIRYHGRIGELARNPHLSEMLAKIQGKAHVASHFLWRGDENARLALAEHREILAAVSSGDPDRADQAARAHVMGIQARLPSSLPDARGSAVPASAVSVDGP